MSLKSYDFSYTKNLKTRANWSDQRRKSNNWISPSMVNSIFMHCPWTRIFALAVMLGLWITAVVPGCRSHRLALRALHHLIQTTDTLNPERNHEI